MKQRIGVTHCPGVGAPEAATARESGKEAYIKGQCYEGPEEREDHPAGDSSLERFSLR